SEEGLRTTRPADFSATLESHLAAAGASEDVPVVICGMAGARQGWFEAGYVDLPARLAALSAACVRVAGARRDLRIVPGRAQRGPDPDVIRGEETQLLGLLRERPAFTGLVALPGTHSKWVHVEAGAVIGFSTCLTGELYALLSENSILRHSL